MSTRTVNNLVARWRQLAVKRVKLELDEGELERFAAHRLSGDELRDYVQKTTAIDEAIAAALEHARLAEWKNSTTKQQVSRAASQVGRGDS